MEPELRDKITATHQDMKWVKRKMKDLCTSIKDHRDGTDEQFAELEKRMGKLETFKDKVYTALAVISLGIGGTWAKITKWF